MSVLSLYFGFRGRINLKTYWLAGIVTYFGTVGGLWVFGVILDLLGVLDTAEWVRFTVYYFILFFILLMLLLFVFWTGPALAIKRLHDTGGSAWYYLWMAIPVFGFLLLLEDGTEGDNKYGPDPGPGVHWHSTRYGMSPDDL